MILSEHADETLTERQVRSIATLIHSVFPGAGRTIDDMIAEWLEGARVNGAANSDSMRFVLWENDQAIAHAHTFGREIFTTEGSLKQMALSAVCVVENRRGEGLGARLMRKVFGCVDEGVWPVSLFQTPVPAFYEKLGGRVIDNEFVNSRNAEDPEASPWWEAEVMIYPADFAWPEGRIDMNGGGY